MPSRKVVAPNITSNAKLRKFIEDTLKRASCPPAVKWTDLLVDDGGVPQPTPAKSRKVGQYDLLRRLLGSYM